MESSDDISFEEKLFWQAIEYAKVYKATPWWRFKAKKFRKLELDAAIRCLKKYSILIEKTDGH